MVFRKRARPVRVYGVVTWRRSLLRAVAVTAAAALTMTPLGAQAFEQNTANLTGGTSTLTQTQPSGLDITYGITGSDLVAAPGGGMSGRGGVAANFISGFSTGSPTLQLTADYDECAVPDRNVTTYCTNRGAVTINFEHPTKNPVVHVAGLGGNARGSTGGFFSRDQMLVYSGALKLTGSSPAGAAPGSVLAGTNLEVNSGYIQAANPRTDASCSATLGNTGGINIGNGSTAGCGSVSVQGTYSQLTFQIDMRATCLTESNHPDCDQVNPGSDLFLVSVTNGLDFGDAPASYNGTNAAQHVTGSLALGATSPDDDGGGRNPTASPVAVAGGASANGGNGDGSDEDAFGSLPDVIAQGASAYALTVPVSGTSKGGAVSGWIDFNRNGVFDSGEKATSTFSAGANSVNLSFNKPAGLTPGLTYARFRTAFDAGDVANPNGAAASGEVEDYSLNIVNEVAQFTFTKSAGTVQDTNSDGINSVGDKVTYTFTVTNSGNATINSIAISDPKIASVTCPTTMLAAGASTTCSGTYTLTGTDVAAGNVANTATVNGTTVNGTAVSKTASTNRSVNQVTRATLTKAVGALTDLDSNGPDVGDTIGYTFTVTNTGNLPLTAVSINDPKITAVTCPAGAVAPGGTKQCTGTYTLTQADVDAGKVDNSATATVTSTAGSSTTSPSTATKTFTPTKSFTFDKQASAVNDLDTNGPDAGDTITYSFVFTNTGTTSLNAPRVTDNLVGAVTCPAAPIGPGASVTCTKTYTLTQANVDSGAVNNSATGVIKGPDGTDLPTSPPDQTSTTVTPSNAIKVTKTAGTPNLGPNGRPDPGDTIAYTFEIENTGGSTLTNPTISDPKVGAVTCAAATLAPGQKITCTKTYAMTQADINGGKVDNSATASASLPGGTVITSAPSTTSTPLQKISTVDFDKTAGSIVDANGNSLTDAGDTIQYSFTTINTGNTTLNSITINDALVGAVTCSPTTLAPGATLVCTKTYTLTQADLDAGAVNNSATVTSTPQGGSPFTSTPDATSTPINATGTMALSKVAGSVNDLDGNGPDVGDTIPYTFTVTNTGTATINGITISDPKISASAISCTPGSIAPNATSTCTATYTLTQADVNAGKVDNSATANGTKAGGGPVSANQTVTKTFVPNSNFTFDKQAGTINTGPDGRADVGDTIDYTFVFSNTGATTLTAPGVTDAKIGPVACGLATLNPGQSISCTATYALVQADLNGGAVNNTATGDMNAPVGLPEPTDQTDSTSTPVGADNALTMTKTAGAIATGPDGRADVGDTITYTFVATNPGNQTITSLAISDPKIGAVSCPTTTLAPGASTTCTKSYSLTQTDINAGTVDNTATVSGKNPAGDTITSDPATASTNVPAVASLVLDKTAGTYADVNSNGRTDTGDTIQYSFTIQNTGNVTLNPVTVDDPKIGAVTCPTGALAPGATVSCTPKSYTIAQADVDAGAVNNSATATGTSPAGSPVTSSPDTTSTTTTDVRTLSLTKSAGAINDLDSNGPDADDTVPYTITVTNTGTTTVTNLVVTDPKLPGLTCSTATLAGGASTTCTGTYVLTQADVDAGVVINTATVAGEDPAGDPVTASATNSKTVVASSSFSFDKQAGAIDTGPDGRADVGDTITYGFVFTNTGTTTLKSPTVLDAKVGTVTCPTGSVAPGVSVTCPKVYALTQADIDGGAVNNTATGTMTPNDAGSPAPVPATRTDSTSTPVTAATVLQLTKTAGSPVDANSSGALDAGDTIVYTFTLQNTGNTTLNSVTITDPKVGAVSCVAGPIAPGGTKVCTKTYAISQADMDLGSIDNTATASATDTKGNPVDSNPSTASTPLAADPQITIDKQADSPSDVNGNGKVDAGDTIAYSFVVENTGNVTLTDVTVNDPKVGTVTCPGGPLAPGATRTCGPATYEITQPDADAGTVDNTATVTGTPPVGADVTDSDSTSTATTQESDLLLTKTAGAVNDLDGNGTDVDDTVPYTITVTNTGTQTITSLDVTDPKIAALTCSPTTLAAGQSATCTGTYTITQVDVDAGKIDNAATATGTDPVGDPVQVTGTNTKTLQPTSSFTFDKQAASPADANTSGSLDAGDTITYSFVFTNTGTTSLRNPQVTDAKIGPVTCATGSVLPGDSVTCTKVYTLSQVDIDAGAVNNTATGVIDSPPGRPAPTPPSRTDSTSSALVLDNALQLTKTASVPADTNGNSRVDLGEEITYTFDVENTGAQTLTLLNIADPKIGAVTCPTTTVAPGQTVTCTKAYPVTQADIDTGAANNSASANASAPGGGSVTSNTSTTSTVITRAPDVVLDKQAGTYTDVNSNGSVDAGDTIRYEFVVQNTGNTSVSQLSVSDPKIGAVTCPIGNLLPGTSTSCSPKTYTITQADADSGAVANSATVTVKPAGLPPVTSDPDVTSTPTTTTSSLKLTKTAGVPVDSDGNGPDVGDLLPYSFVVLNTGTTTLTDVAVVDPKISGALTCAPLTLAPGEQAACSGNHVLTQAEIDAGVVDNTATANANGPGPTPVSDTATASKSIVPVSSFTFDKQAGARTDVDGDLQASEGDTIAYTFVFTNTGTTTLASPSVVDAKIATISCSSAPVLPGGQTSCTGTYVLTQADVDSGAVNNTATGSMTASPNVPQPTSKSDGTSTEVPETNQLEIVKTASAPADTDADGKVSEGDLVTYTFAVTNSGNQTLTNVGIVDALVGPVTCPAGDLSPLTSAPANTVDCTVDYALTQSDIDLGSVVNTASATADTPGGDQVVSEQDSAQVDITAAPSISLDKQAGALTDVDGNGPDRGDTIDFTFLIENTGNVSVDDVVVSDPTVGPVTCPASPLAPGAVRTCGPITYTLTQADVDSGVVNNNAIATATGPTGQSLSSSDSTSTATVGAGALQTVKTAGALTDPDGNGPDAGDTLTYNFALTNIGTTSLTVIEVTDANLGGTFACSPEDLLPGEVSNCSGTYTLTQADVDAGEIENSATGSALDPSGTPVSSTDTITTPLNPRSEFSLDKQAGPIDLGADNRPSVGDTITYTFTLTNDGGTTLSGASIDDPKIGAVTCAADSIEPGESITCSKDYALTQVDIDGGAVNNSATGSMAAPAGVAQPTDVSDSTSTPIAGSNTLTLTKVAGPIATGPDGRADLGDTIEYTFTVTNTGNRTVESIAITDPKLASTTCDVETLTPAGQATCTGTYPLAQADIDAGAVNNQATASGVDLQGDPVTSPVASADVDIVRVTDATLDKAVSEVTDVNLNGVTDAGDTIEYTFAVFNAGNATLSSIAVADPKVGVVTCPAGPLAPGATLTCSPKTYTVTSQDVLAGAAQNTATATVTSVDGSEASGTDSTSTSTSARPTAIDDTSTGIQGQPQSVDPLINDSAGDPAVPLDAATLTLLDTAGDPAVSVSVVGGVYTVDNGSLVFTPDPTFTGDPDPVDYRVNDTKGTSVSASYQPSVTAVTPIAVDDDSTGLQGRPQTVAVLANDSAGNLAIPLDAGTVKLLDGVTPVDFLIVSGVGRYDVAGSNIVFTPEPAYTGTPALVDYQVADENGTLATAQLAVEVTAVTPVATNDTATGDQGLPVTISVFDNDTAGDPLVPLDRTSLTLLDGAGDPVDFLVINNVGRYDVVGDEIVFTPEPQFTGPVTAVTYQIADVNGTPTNATIATTIDSVTPAASNDSSTDSQGRPQTVSPLGNDQAGNANVPLDPTSLILLNAAGDPVTSVPVAGGVYTVTGDQITFTPEANFTGDPDPVTYQVADANGTTATASYQPSVTPVTRPDTSAALQGQPQTVDPLANDDRDATVVLDPGTLELIDPATGLPTDSVQITGQGTYSVDNGEITFTPVPAFSGAATPIAYQAADQTGALVSDTYSPTVVSLTPGANPDVATGPQGLPLTVDPVANDNPGDPSVPLDAASLTLLDAAGDPATTVSVAAGVYTLTNGEITFTPNRDFTGTAAPVTYQIADTNGTTATATFAPTLTPVTPVAHDGMTTGPQGVPQTVDPLWNDNPGDPGVPLDPTTLTLLDASNNPTTTVVTADGTYTLTNGEITFTPELDFVGTPDPVTYRVADENGTTTTAKYRPTVIAVTPQANNDSSTGTQGAVQTVNVLTNDTAGDPAVPLDSDTVTLLTAGGLPVTSVTVTGGQYELGDDGVVTFTPNPDFTGDPAPVSYRVLDVNGTPTTAKYQPSVAPVTRPDTTIGLQGADQTVDPLTNDTLSPVTLLPATLTLIDPATGQPSTTVQIPNQGTYSVENGQITFNPLSTFVGGATPITYLVDDAAGNTLSDTYTPTVLALNPGVEDDSSNGPQGVAQTVDPLRNDTPGDPSVPLDPTSVTLLNAAGNPAVTVPVTGGVYTLLNGEITFTPDSDFVGTPDPVTYRVADENGTIATATYTPTFFAVTPVAANDSSTGLQGAAQTVDPLVNDSPGDNAVPLDATSVTLLNSAGSPAATVPVTGGVYSLAGGQITFTPDADFTGAATPVTYRVADVNGTTTTATYTPSVVAVSPIARNDSSTGLQGAAQTVDPLVNDSPGDNAVPLDATSVTLLNSAGSPAATVPVTGGVYSLAGGQITFTPDADFTGAATPVTYRVADVNGTTTTATYTPSVVAVSPIARNDSSTGLQGAAQTVDPLVNDLAGDDDVPLDPTTLTLLNAAGNPATTVPVAGGVYRLANGEITFTPDVDFTGAAPAVTYRVADENGTTTTATYTPSVTAVAPSPVNDTSSGKQGATQSINPLNNDNPGDPTVPLDPTTLTLLDGTGAAATEVPVAGGIYTLVNGQIVFTPDSSFVGAAPPVTYEISDENGTPATATYTPTVTSIDPIAEDDDSTGLQGAAQSVDPLLNDTPGDDDVALDAASLTLLDAAGDPALTVTVADGVYSVAGGMLVFTPDPTFVGQPDPVRYQISDANGTSATAEYQPTVTAVTPVAQNDTSVGIQGGTQSVNPLTNDDAGDPTVPLDPPTLTLLNAAGDPVTTVTVAGGSYTVVSGRITFTPDPGFTGVVPPVTYRVADQNGTTTTADYQPVITEVVPTANDDTATGVVNQSVSVDPLINDTVGDPAVPLVPATLTLLDAAGDPATTVIVGDGVYSIDDGRLVFTPAQDFFGTPEPVTYRVADQNGTTSTAQFSPVIEEVDTVLNDDVTTGTKGQQQSIDPLANDVFDADHPVVPTTLTLLGSDGDPATIVTVTGGSYRITGGEIVFTPLPDFVGAATPVTYRVDDVNNSSYTATYTPTVTAPLPTAANDTSSGKQGVVQSVDPLANDIAGDPTVPFDATTLTLLDAGGNPAPSISVEGGIYTVDNGRLVFTPDLDFVGTATAAPYQVADADGRLVTATYTPTVTAITPMAADDTSSGKVNQPQSVNPLANDTAGDPGVPLDPTTLTLLNAAGQPAASVSVTGGEYTVDSGRLVFTPTSGFVGSAPPVRYQIADMNGTLATARYTPVVADGSIVKNIDKTAPAGTSVTFDPVAATPGLTPGSVRLIDPSSGASVLQLVVPGEGTWTVETSDGTVVFEPDPDLKGDPTPVDYVGETADGTPVLGTLSIDYPGTGGTPGPGGNGDGGNGGGNGTGNPGTVIGLTPGTGSGVGGTGISLLPGTGASQLAIPLGLLGLLLVGLGVVVTRRRKDS